MKRLFTIALALTCFSVQAQKWGREFGFNYVYANPVGGMGRIIEQGHGITTNFGWVTPNQQFAFGLDLSFAQYGRDKTRQEYTFDDGSIAPMDIIVSNNFANFTAYSRWYLRVEGPLRPFLMGRLGYSEFSTDLNIYDPDDFDHCEPVDNELLYNDGTVLAGIGAGVKIDMASLFKKLKTGMFYFESSINLTQGGHVRYMNADASNGHHPSHTPDADQVMASFINTQTQVVHKHHVGYLYENPSQMTELRFGFSMNLFKK